MTAAACVEITQVKGYATQVLPQLIYQVYTFTQSNGSRSSDVKSERHGSLMYGFNICGSYMAGTMSL